MSDDNTRNYDLSQLALEVDNRPWILGESVLGEAVLGGSGSWDSVIEDFVSIEVRRSVQVENGALFRPEAATMTLVTENPISSAAVYNKPVRLRYGSTVLFRGKVNDWSDDLTPGDVLKPVEHAVQVDAADRTDFLSKLVLSGWLPISEDGDARALKAYPSVVTTSLDRIMPTATEATSPSALDVLQEIADANLARFYTAADNTVILDGSAATATGIVFVDAPYSGAGNPLDYSRVSVRQSLDDIVTAVTATAKSDDTAIAHRSAGAVTTREVACTVDLPDTTAVTAWAASFPLSAFASVVPSSLVPKVDRDSLDDLLGIELLDLVDVISGPTQYTSGISAISHVITPARWDITYALVPDYLIVHPTVVPPGPVRSLTATPLSTTSVKLDWIVPQSLGAGTGYEVRRLAGTTAPADRTQGTLVASLATSVLTFTDTGLTHKTDYAYSVFTTTADPTLNSPPCTVAGWTLLASSTAPRSLHVVYDGSGFRPDNSIPLAWTAPATVGDIAQYKITAHPEYVSGPTVTKYVAYPATSTSVPVTQVELYTVTIVALSPTWHAVTLTSPSMTISE